MGRPRQYFPRPCQYCGETIGRSGRTRKRPAVARELILRAFESAAEHRLTSAELATLSPSFRDHVAALRRIGHEIETRQVDRQTYEYKLISEVAL